MFGLHDGNVKMLCIFFILQYYPNAVIVLTPRLFLYYKLNDSGLLTVEYPPLRKGVDEVVGSEFREYDQ